MSSENRKTKIDDMPPCSPWVFGSAPDIDPVASLELATDPSAYVESDKTKAVVEQFRIDRGPRRAPRAPRFYK